MSSYVYILELKDTGNFSFIKIGLTDSPKMRYSQIRTSLPFIPKMVALYMPPNARKVEKFIHKVLSPFKVNGEWYGKSDNFEIELKKLTEKMEPYIEPIEDHLDSEIKQLDELLG